MSGREGCVAKTGGSLVEVVIVLTEQTHRHPVHEPRFPRSNGVMRESDIILLCVRWYLRYPLSYRKEDSMMLERGHLVYCGDTSSNEFINILPSNAAKRDRYPLTHVGS